MLVVAAVMNISFEWTKKRPTHRKVGRHDGVIRDCVEATAGSGHKWPNSSSGIPYAMMMNTNAPVMTAAIIDMTNCTRMYSSVSMNPILGMLMSRCESPVWSVVAQRRRPVTALSVTL